MFLFSSKFQISRFTNRLCLSDIQGDCFLPELKIMYTTTDMQPLQVYNTYVILFYVIFSVGSNNRCVVVVRGEVMIVRWKGVECCVSVHNTGVQ